MSSERSKAILFRGAGKPFELCDFPLPSCVEAGAVLVRTRMATVCGSDLYTWLGKRSFPVPSILGHEIVGNIVALGDDVERDTNGNCVTTGDRITWTIMSNCGTCLFCRMKELPQKCIKPFKYGHVRSDLPPHLTGGFAEYVYLRPGTCFFKIPDDMEDAEVAPLMCAASTVTAGYDVVRPDTGENIVIQGAGMLGHYAMAMARERTPNHLIVMDVKDERLRTAEEFGADIVFNLQKCGTNEAVREIMDCTGGVGADLVIEVSGDPSVINLGINMLRSGGRYLLLGAILSNSYFEIDSHDLITKCLTLTGIHNYDAKHLGKALAFVNATRSRYPYKKLVGDRFALTTDGLSKAMKSLESGSSLRPAIVP